MQDCRNRLAFTIQGVRLNCIFDLSVLFLLIVYFSTGEQGVIDEENPTKVSTAEITLKSATLPRRKIGR